MSKRKSRMARNVRIALVYARQHDHFHIDEIKQVCHIRPGRYEDAVLSEIMREVKDAAPFELWPVYERRGWWTTVPTHEVRVVALHAAANRNATESQRQADLMRRHRRGDSLTSICRVGAKQAVGIKELYEDDLPSPERQDSCLMAIDRLMANDGEEETHRQLDASA